tara:strand:- start:5415 stop:6230 length:816 start_codon:yes stop_codon:yes gene_type:complete
MNLEGKQFATKKDLFEYLHLNKSEILDMKKASKKTYVSTPDLVAPKMALIKALSTSTESDTDSLIKRTIVGNTYNWLDSHGDVHVGSTFGKSLSERAGKVWHLHDHEYKLTAKVGTPTKVYEQEIKWSDLGVDKAGSTIALMMDSNIKKSMNSQIFNEYKTGSIDQHSVGMYYVKMDLAINDSEYEDEFKVWNNTIEKIGNKAKAEEQGFFWAVKEAKLIEISAVLEGSNELTPTIPTEDIEPFKSTQNNEPLKDTQNETKEKNISSIHYY